MTKNKAMYGRQRYHQLDPCKGTEGFGRYRIRSYFGARSLYPMLWLSLLTAEDEYPWQAGRISWRRNKALGTTFTKVEAMRIIGMLDVGAFRFAVEKEAKFKQRRLDKQPWHPALWLGSDDEGLDLG